MAHINLNHLFHRIDGRCQDSQQNRDTCFEDSGQSVLTVDKKLLFPEDDKMDLRSLNETASKDFVGEKISVLNLQRALIRFLA